MSSVGDAFYRDKELDCIDCALPFTFSGGEQRFFEEKGLSQPKRCPQCRTFKKQRSTKANA